MVANKRSTDAVAGNSHTPAPMRVEIGSDFGVDQMGLIAGNRGLTVNHKSHATIGSDR